MKLISERNRSYGRFVPVDESNGLRGVCHLMIVVVVVVERLLTLYVLFGSYDDGEISFVISYSEEFSVWYSWQRPEPRAASGR